MRTFKEGDLIKVQVAEEFELSLPAGGAMGYEWEVEKVTPGLTFLGHISSEEEKEGSPPPEEIGGEHPLRFRFRADQPGSFDAHLIYKRPWEHDVRPDRELTVRITVQGAA